MRNIAKSANDPGLPAVPPHHGRIWALIAANIALNREYFMRRFAIAALALVASLSATAFALTCVTAQAQQTQLLPLKPPPPPPIKPYTPVAAKPPVPYDDAAFQAFRKQLVDIAAKKDRAALAKLVVPKGFFWLQDKDVADPKKPGIDNLAKATSLDATDGSGWGMLGALFNDPTVAQFSDHNGVMCAPADPTIDAKAFGALAESTQTDPSEWGYAVKDGVEVHDAAQPNAPTIEKLGLNLVRVLPDTAPPTGSGPVFLHVATPSGKTGFIAADDIAPLGGDQICYVKDAGGAWKITGYFGGAVQQ
jgi:hypothetical protein